MHRRSTGRPAPEPPRPSADPRPTEAALGVAVRPGDRARGRSSTASSSSIPRQMARNPVMFVVEVGSVLTTILFFATSAGDTATSCSPGWSPSGSGSRCCSPTSPRRWPRAGARPRPTRCARPASETVAHVRRRRRDRRGSRRARSQVGDVCVVEAGRDHPRRRRDHRGHRLGRRVGHHRRVGAGHPRVRRRPLGGHRRHPGAVRPDRRAHHGQAGRDVPRPHDRPRRGRRAGRRPRTRSPSTSCWPA